MRRPVVRSLVVLVACGLAAVAGLRAARHLGTRAKKRPPERFRGEVHRAWAGYVPESEARP